MGAGLAWTGCPVEVGKRGSLEAGHYLIVSLADDFLGLTVTGHVYHLEDFHKGMIPSEGGEPRLVDLDDLDD
jgi:hypothetical protein